MEGRITEIDVLLLFPHKVSVISAIGFITGGEFSELHDVTRKCTGLVGKNIIDHAKLVDQIGRLGLHRHIFVSAVRVIGKTFAYIKHVRIEFHEHGLPELCQLHLNDQ